MVVTARAPFKVAGVEFPQLDFGPQHYMKLQYATNFAVIKNGGDLPVILIPSIYFHIFIASR
jgi:hypothetical protein